MTQNVTSQIYGVKNVYGSSAGTVPLYPIVTETVDPTAQTLNYPQYQLWVNSATNALWILLGLVSSNGVVTANWEKIGFGTSVATTYDANVGSATPAANVLNILGAGGVTTTASGNTVTISATVSSMTWNTISASQALVKANGYFCVSPGGALSLSLPATSTVGDTISVALSGATSWTITQAAGQAITFGSKTTTTGVGGSLSSTANGDTVTIVAWAANTSWYVISSMGNITVV